MISELMLLLLLYAPPHMPQPMPEKQVCHVARTIRNLKAEPQKTGRTSKPYQKRKKGRS